ncbi:MAG: tyrosine-type recombinase/integrase [Planctomycetaceae bacterium]|nr:tyrosine-type recombinase/integrase [Planctomycetaceae bacterium]
MAGLFKRNGIFYAKWYIAGQPRKVSLKTGSIQIAKAKLRQIEGQLDQGEENPLPTKTPLAQAVKTYLDHIRVAKSPNSVLKDANILRVIFGPIIPELEQIGRKQNPRVWKRKKHPTDGRRKCPRIQAAILEEITTAQVAEFISSSARLKGLAPRTANRYREVLSRLFSWSMTQAGVKMPNDKNPAQAVERYRQKAPEIRFLTLAQIDEQLDALADQPELHTTVAMYIYAGLRREELLWLQVEDVDLAAGTNGMIRIRAKTVHDQAWQPKTRDNRAVPISTALRSWLDKYAPKPSIGGWYFPSPDGHRWDVDNFSKALHVANARAKLSWTCLDYRHTFGSHLASKGESLYKVSALMGNSPEICRLHYASLIPATLIDSVEFESTDKCTTQTA